jgi:hypothetical protein
MIFLWLEICDLASLLPLLNNFKPRLYLINPPHYRERDLSRILIRGRGDLEPKESRFGLGRS